MGSEVTHRMIQTNGIQMHVAEQGTGPTVLLIHGFPEVWFSWRNQITQLAKHGYHVVAPDMRGNGDTDSPASPELYTLLHLVGDVIGLLDALGQEKVFVVGHDTGAEVAWHLCLFRPERIKALVNLSVPFRPRFPAAKPVEMLTRMLGEGLYISQFQVNIDFFFSSSFLQADYPAPISCINDYGRYHNHNLQELGRAEKSFARYGDYTVIKKFLLTQKPDLVAPPGEEIIDSLENQLSLPSWISEVELQYIASKFQKSGFTGALNFYRAMDRNWELLAPWQGARITVPTKFIVGDKDLGLRSFGTEEYITGGDFKSFVPYLEVIIIDGHHFIQQEKARAVSEEILSFLDKFSNV
ncbi:hypothetical protein H6P81_004810 [Aristolochia fimbriata]|uniref:AB hydrolase-1 domain-containing protein n=1 Tax=Aristolochia fimbriata TaxID=158543 RepID=A0AAV7EW95_ARIFI|nr:hypothetical protein H6P81_004810 [Aristolochia fimbriata]